ncbi:MAG: hypothetical protein WB729_08115 [Candidatus Sulfotelmatobacter sp.]|jgi:thymidylate kinase
MKQHKLLVAVVGGDGAGKTTVSTELVQQLNELGYKARCVGRWDIVDNPAYPSARFMKNDIRHIRKCVADMPPHPRFLFLLWTMSLSLSADVTRDSDDEIVVMDGYWMKHAASEVAYGLAPEWVLSVSSGLPVPQIVLHLSLTPEQAWPRKQADLVPYECGMDESCSKESFLQHQTRIRNLLDEWSRAFGWKHIDASPSLAVVISTAVSQVLSAVPREVTRSG